DGFRPMQLLLMGLAGCTGMDIVSILQKKRLDIAGVEVRVEADRAETHPMVYTDIDLTYIVHGRNVPASAVEQAIELSETKYCSASAMLGTSAKITTRYELIDEAKSASELAEARTVR
ncbi:MAG: OsmC family protein, partial [Rudaea sp.]